MFQEQQPKLLLEALAHLWKFSAQGSPISTLDKEPYKYRASRRGTIGSLDQLDIHLNVISDYYFCSPEDTCGLHFSKMPSVLNVLLHFSKDKLIVDDHTLYCRYRSVDEWHEATTRLGEDIFTTAHLAAYDLGRGSRVRNKFLWSPYLSVETNDVNHLFALPISELHAHLKGSSLIFALSWLSLMNYPCHREKDFLRLFDKKNFEGNDKKSRDLRDLYECVALAVALRFFLFLSKTESDTSLPEDWIKSLSCGKSIEEIQPILAEMSACAWNFRTTFGMFYDKFGNCGKCPDYAVSDGSEDLFSILTGERCILYNAFRQAYDGNDKVALCLYAYIVFKQQLREKIIQLNDVVGFANFDTYEQRKSCFIPNGSVYERLLTPMAFLNFLGLDNSKRYMEGRVTPKETVEENSQSVLTMDKQVKVWLADKDKTEDEYKKVEERVFNGYYIFHFIKTSDEKPSELSPRHHQLRRKVKKQAIALYEFRKKGYKSASRVVGIDAANSEIKCRPEVFAQAFRFLRRHAIQENVENHPAVLGMTYHVGEDFYDIVDGLRAVDEVLTFMNFRSNDRLGHAMVLGTDVAKYYKSRGKAIRATRQVLLDNFVWLYVRVANVAGRISLCEYLEYEARHLYKLIYDETDCDIQFDIHDYYDSWLLRGDAPETALIETKKKIEIEKEIENSISDWGKAALNIGEADVNRARMNKNARSLYFEYHFNKKAQEQGNKSIILPITHNYYEEFVKMVDEVRELLLCKVERLHIAIECNPSSNLRIGEMTSYIEHPIFKFNNYGLNTPYPPHEISVSINTDDSGVFSTSLEREYALMGIALEKTDDERFKNSPRAVKEWLNRVRKMSVEQRFKKE